MGEFSERGAIQGCVSCQLLFTVSDGPAFGGKRLETLHTMFLPNRKPLAGFAPTDSVDPRRVVRRFLARTGRPTTFADISQQFLTPTFYRRKRFADATICETEISGVFDSVANHADSPALGAATDVGDFRHD